MINFENGEDMAETITVFIIEWKAGCPELVADRPGEVDNQILGLS